MVLLDELITIKPTKYCIAISKLPALQEVTNEILNNPGDKRTIDDFANIACVSTRTLARLFVKELGLTFSDWRRQAKLFYAIEKLGKGHSVSLISVELGYNSPSAFIEMFRKEFGVSPSKYIVGISEH